MDCNNNIINTNKNKNKQVHSIQLSSVNSHGVYLRAAIMTVIQSCIAATIKGWLLYELQILIGKIQCVYICIV